MTADTRAAAEKLLDDYLAKKREEDIETIHRSAIATLFKHKSTDEEAVVIPCGRDWVWLSVRKQRNGCIYNMRENAEAAAKQSLMEGK